MQKIEGRYFQLKKSKKKELKDSYISNLYWRNELHVFQSEGTYFNGRLIDVESSGKLVMEVENGVRLFDFKEIQFIK